MLFWITGSLALINLLFLLALLSLTLFNIEGGWIREEPLVGIFFAYTTILLFPTTLDLFSKKLTSADSQVRANRVLFNLFIGIIGLLLLGIAHLLSGGNHHSLAAFWFFGVLLIFSTKDPYP